MRGGPPAHARDYARTGPSVRPGPRPDGRPDRLRREQPPRGPIKPYRTGVQSAGEGPPGLVPAPEVHPLGRLRPLLNGFQFTASLLAAYSLGIFAEIHRRPQSAADIAKHCGAEPRGIDALLGVLVALGVIHKHGETYVLPRDLATYLVPGVDGDGTGMIDMAADLYTAWIDLPRGIKEGTPRHRLSSEALLAGDPERVRRYIRGVHTVSREAARRVAEMAPLLPGSSLLDVGGGSGIFAAEYARRTPDLKAHLFDLPPTLEIARDILFAEGLDGKVNYCPGDYRQDPFPGPVDTILVSNVLQTESEEHAFAILRKAHEALRPGGTLLIHGTMLDPAGPPSAQLALFSLLMYVVFDHGTAYSAEQISEWLAQERFGVRSVRPVGSPLHTKLIIATRLD
jgi:ubiquinone/menaquinone biosynthesis C-methylase UbiE